MTSDSVVANFVREHVQELASCLLEKHCHANPDSAECDSETRRLKCFQDCVSHFEYLSQALLAGEKLIFTDYVAWTKILLEQYGLHGWQFSGKLELMKQVLDECLPEEDMSSVFSYIDSGVSNLPLLPDTLPSTYDETQPLTALARQYQAALLDKNRTEAAKLVLNAVDNGTSVKDIYLYVFQACMIEIGRLWQLNRISIAHEHYCTASTQLILAQLYPHLFTSRSNGFKLLATSVEGNLHEMGIRMVADFFEMEGWDTVYLGANTPSSSVIEMLAEYRPDVLAISATLALQLGSVKELIDDVRQHFGGSCPKILVGGAPFNRNSELWKTVGADICGHDAQDAISKVQQLVMHD